MEKTDASAGRESTGGVVGVAHGLFLILAPLMTLAYFALSDTGGSGAELLDEILIEEFPYGLELVESPRLATGEQLLVLEPGEAGRDLIEQVILGVYAKPGDVKGLFMHDEEKRQRAGGIMVAWERDPTFEWHTELDRGEVEWRDWKATFVRERAFQEGGGWKDATRVNLSTSSRYLVLFALWPAETEPSEEVLQELLKRISLPTEES